jgi:hypothetical protein
MPRGSKPGERRGARQKGTPNKRTALVRALTIAALDTGHISPLELSLALMRNETLPLEGRVKAALDALPYVHAKLRRRGTAKRPAKKAKHDVDGPGNGHIDTDDIVRGIGPRVRTKRIVVDGESPDADITPLRFLQRVMCDTKASAKLRIKIAAKIMPYVHYKPSGKPGEAEQIADAGRARAMVVKDQFGFDPELIEQIKIDEIRLRRLQQARAATGKESPEERELIARIKQRQRLLCCPKDYTVEEYQKDQQRYRELVAKRVSKQANSRLTADEKVELLHISGRMDLFFNGPPPDDPQTPPDSRVADLVQAGKLRVGLGLGSPALAVKESTDP